MISSLPLPSRILTAPIVSPAAGDAVAPTPRPPRRKTFVRRFTPPLLLLTCLSLPIFKTMADLTTAQSYLKEAQDLVANREFDRAKAKLELVDVELEDVPAAQKAPVAEAARKTLADMATAAAAANKPRYLRQLNNLIDDAERSVGNLATWPGIENRLTEIFADPVAQVAVPAEIAAAQKKFATFKKLHDRKAGAELTAGAAESVRRLETEWAAMKDDLNDSNLRSLHTSLQRLQQQIHQLPADADATKQLAARVDAIATAATGAAASGETAEVVERIKRNVASYQDDFAGWEQEATTPGPTWEAYTKQTSVKMSAFFAPKTVEFRGRIESILGNLKDNESYKSVATAPAVKAQVDALTAQMSRATETLLKRINPVVAAAEKAPVKDPNELERLRGDVGRALGHDSAESKALMARLQGRLEAHEAATTGASEAQEKLVVTLRAKADEIWPGFEAGFNPTTEINLAKPGQQIRFTADNLMGYRFKPGDFYFATTLGGHPVAARFAPGLKAAIDAVETKIGRSLGDNDDDGKWEVIATVTAQKVRLLAKRQVDSSGTLDGVDVKITTNYAEPVDAVVIEILAAKCGPFAGAKGLGILTPAGTVAK